MRDLQPVMVADACASIDEELHLGALRALAHGFAMIASSRQIQSALEAGEPAVARPAMTASRERPRALPRELDLAVVGAGPGGLAAAIQARRENLMLAMLDPGRPGGQARAAERIENYPGFPGGIPGSELMRRFVAQARQLQLSALPVRVLSVSAAGEGGLRLDLEGIAQPLSARVVILAPGCAPRRLEIEPGPGAEIVCHQVDQIPVVRGRRILVVGGGEAAFDQALLASRLGAATVTLAMRGDAPRAIEILVRRAETRGIEILAGTTVCGISDESVEETGARRVTLSRRGDRFHLPADAVVVCIGKVPRFPDLPPGALSDGRPAVDKLGRTPVEGLYMVGDIHRGPYRQVAIAVGDGVAAAMHAARFIRGGDWRS
jgi:thioredoxin reductase (NADPH)